MPSPAPPRLVSSQVQGGQEGPHPLHGPKQAQKSCSALRVQRSNVFAGVGSCSTELVWCWVLHPGVSARLLLGHGVLHRGLSSTLTPAPPSNRVRQQLHGELRDAGAAAGQPAQSSQQQPAVPR